MSPRSEDGLPPDPTSPSAAIRLSVSAETTGLDASPSEATTGSFLRRKKSRFVAHTSPGRSNRWMLCADAHCPMGPGKARRLPNRALPTYSAKSWCPRDASTKASPAGILQAMQSFFQGYNWVFEVFFPQLETCLCSLRDVFFGSWITVFLTPVLGCLLCLKGFRFFDSQLDF